MLNPPVAFVHVYVAGVLYLRVWMVHSEQQWEESLLCQMHRDNCSLFVTSVGMRMNRRLIQLSVTWLGWRSDVVRAVSLPAILVQ